MFGPLFLKGIIGFPISIKYKFSSQRTMNKMHILYHILMLLITTIP